MEHANIKMHPGTGPSAHAAQIPACREFETHPGFPFTRELDEATPGIHARSFSPFNPPCFRFASVARPLFSVSCLPASVCEIFLEKRSQTMPVFIGFL
jgi:hypothetical protein